MLKRGYASNRIQFDKSPVKRPTRFFVLALLLAGMSALLINFSVADAQSFSEPQQTCSVNCTASTVTSGLISSISQSDLSSQGAKAVTVFNPILRGRTLGSVNFTAMPPSSQGFEGDVAPRGGGNGVMDLADYVQLGRFAAGLDEASAESEFQRADCAPREALGNGSITTADYVQAGRYAAGLDTPVPAQVGQLHRQLLRQGSLRICC